jgi:hypothetical protein
MKNKLIIREEVKPDNTLTYVVEDKYTVYMLTGNLACAKELVENLKLEYNREKQNAS